MIPDHSTEIEQLLNKAESLRWDSLAYRELIETAEQALILARKINDPKWIVKSLNMIAWGYNRLELPINSLEYAIEATRLSKQHDLIEDYGYALINHYFCYMSIGEIDKSLQMVEEALILAETHKILHLQVYAHNDLGHYYMLASDFESSVSLFQRSIALIDEYNLNIPKQFFYLNIAETYIKSGELSRALEICQREYIRATKDNLISEQLFSKELLNNIYLQWNQLDNALQCAQEMYQLSFDAGYRVHNSIFVLGETYTALGKYDKALIAYHKILDFFINNRVDMLTILYQRMAEVYEKQSNHQQALHYLQQAIDASNSLSHVEAEKRLLVLKTLHEVDVIRHETDFQKSQNQLIQSEMEERLKRQRVELLLDKQHEMMDIKTDILTRLNHEFRTPLTVLQTSFEILTRYSAQMTPEHKIDHTKRIEEQFHHIKYLLDDTLDVLQLNNQQNTAINPIRIDLEEFLRSAVALAEKRTRTSNRVQFNPLQPTVIYQDEALLEQILVNLLTNALKFSNDEVQLESFVTAQNQLILTVKDQGIGIPPDEQEAIFEVLRRGSNLDEIGGNGMGLTLVKQSVELLNGKISLKSTLNIGTEFTVIIPTSNDKFMI